MRLNSTIALAAVAAVLASPAAAEAKGHKHARHHAAKPAAEAVEGELTAAEQLQYAQQQISQMQAQLNDLQAKMNAAGGTDKAMAAAQAADAKASKALAAADAVKASSAKTDKAMGNMQWAANTKLSGRIYANFSNLSVQNNGVKTPTTGTGFAIKRVYLGVDHKINDTYSLNVTTDISDVAGTTGNLVGKGLYLKKAYVQAKLSPAFIVRVGAADMPWMPYIEGMEGHRHIENTLVDRLSFGTSADWGVHVLGDLNKYVSYQVSMINGGGYRNAKITNTVDIEGRISANYNGFFAAVGGYTGKQGLDTKGIAVTPRTSERFNAAVGFKNETFTIGGEYFGAKNWKNLTAVDTSAVGYMLFGTYNFTPKLSVFGKYEWAATNHQTAANPKDVYYNLGLQYKPAKNMDVALVYKRDLARGGAIGTSNGTIGAAGAASRGTYDEVGVFTQVRF